VNGNFVFMTLDDTVLWWNLITLGEEGAAKNLFRDLEFDVKGCLFSCILISVNLLGLFPNFLQWVLGLDFDSSVND